jgi:hypothetical protein
MNFVDKVILLEQKASGLYAYVMSDKPLFSLNTMKHLAQSFR